MSQRYLPIAVPHWRLPLLGGLPVLGENVKGHRSRRGWALQAASSPWGARSLGHLPGPGVCKGFRVRNTRAVGGPVCSGGVEGDEGENEVGDEECADVRVSRSIQSCSRDFFHFGGFYRLPN